MVVITGEIRASVSQDIDYKQTGNLFSNLKEKK